MGKYASVIVTFLSSFFCFVRVFKSHASQFYPSSLSCLALVPSILKDALRIFELQIIKLHLIEHVMIHNSKHEETCNNMTIWRESCVSWFIGILDRFEM